MVSAMVSERAAAPSMRAARAVTAPASRSSPASCSLRSCPARAAPSSSAARIAAWRASIAASRPTSPALLAEAGGEPGRGEGEAGADHRLGVRPRHLERGAARLVPGVEEQERRVGQRPGQRVGRRSRTRDPGRRHEVGRIHPDRLRPERRLQRALEHRGLRVDAVAVDGAAEVARSHPEGVVEGLDAPDRPGDEPAEGAERLGLAAEPARVADHLVADEPGRDQVGERRRGGIGGWDVQDEPLDAQGKAGEMSRIRTWDEEVKRGLPPSVAQSLAQARPLKGKLP